MRKLGRAVAIIVKDDNVLIMRRDNKGKKYYTFIGGGIEEGETPEETAIREAKEEVSLDIKIDQFLFKYYNIDETKRFGDRYDHFFLVTDFKGEVELGGPEKEREDEGNLYFPEWHKISEIKNIENLLPEEEKKLLIDWFENEKTIV